MSFINKIGIAKAPYKMEQSIVSEFMQNFYDISTDEKRKIGLMYNRSGIKYRYSAIPDYNSNAENSQLLNSEVNDFSASVEKRMELFFDTATNMCETAIFDCLENKEQLKTITHFITVSCTGMAAPGLDLILLEKLNLPITTHRTSVNFMGCYAVFHALKMADAFCKADPNNKVLIVSVELCTLHFQSNFTMENVAANLLFADGAAACIVTPKQESNCAISLTAFYSEVMLTGKKDMAWHISRTGYLMTLSSFIPQLIESGIGNLLNGVLHKVKLTKDEIKNWAIHPGGRKIVEAIKKELSLNEADVKISFDVLSNYGNMSSATILFVLQTMQLEGRKGKVFACGFGPGLSLETLIGDFV